MFQIWRYRTSWEDFHSSTSWLKIFFDIFRESNGIWSNKIWTGSWLASEGLPGLILEFLTWLCPCPCAWCHYCKCMTTWQLRGHFLDLDSCLLTGSAPAPYPGYSHPVYAVLSTLRTVSVSINIYNLLWSENWWLVSGREPGSSRVPASIPLPSQQYTCTELRPKLSFLAGAYRYPAQRGSCVKMNHWHPT